MRFAIVDNGKVVNVVKADAPFTGGIRSDTANIGDSWIVGDVFEAPVIHEKPEIFITSIACSDPIAIVNSNSVICKKGATVTIVVEIRLEGIKQPVSDNYRIPLRSRDGRERMVLAVFTDGSATISAQLEESGFWYVSEASINDGVPMENQFKFNGLFIDTYI